MTVLDSFYLLFRSDLPDLKKDLADAQKKAEEFKSKLGQSDQVKAGLKDQQKAIQDLNKQVQEASEGNKGLGTSFLDLTAAGVAAFGSIFALGKFKDGALDAAHFNAEMEKLTRLTGVNSSEISAWDSVVQKAGGSAGEFTSWLHDINSQYALAGLGDKVKNIIPQLLVLADEFKRMKDAGDAAGTLALGQRFGLSEGVILTLQQGRAEVEKMLAVEERLAPITARNAQEARDYEKSVVDLERAWRNLFTDVTPALTMFTQGIEGQLIFVKEFFKTFAQGLQGMATLASDVANGRWGHILSWGKDNGDAPPAPSVAAAEPASGSAPLGIRNNNPGNLRRWGGADSVGGYAKFPTLQAGIAAEEQQLRLYGQRGIDTLASIANKWAPSSENNTAAYIAALQQRTGFDPNAHLDLNNPEVLRKVANAINAQEEGGQYGNLITAKDSLGIADRSGLPASQGTQNNVRIDNITINTQATDADGVAAALNDRLTQHFRATTGNFDDGVAR